MRINVYLAELARTIKTTIFETRERTSEVSGIFQSKEKLVKMKKILRTSVVVVALAALIN